ncbi:MAG: DUF4380 domain-containing protein [Verrucomicrobiae bacterium]|nr:DUF4380 domain-containing protein [Verrucomicrobiae bacterium]
MKTRCLRGHWHWLLLFPWLACLPVSAAPQPQITPTNYHGYTQAWRLDNGMIEAIVVPEIGRLMHLSLKGGENVIWINTRLLGTRLDGKQTNWINLGGDKSWPSPEAEWGRYTGDKSWFPPRGFDGLPATAHPTNHMLVLTSALDPHYGIRVIREFELLPGRPALSVRTRYERISGQPSRLGIWIITQLKEPEQVFIPLPGITAVTQGCVALSRTFPPSLTLATNGLLALRRDPRNSYKIGTPAGTLIWVGPNTVVRIDSPRIPQAEYPDRNSSAEVYTNGGELDYVELEMLGPLHTLAPGQSLSQTNTYTLQPRRGRTALQAALDILR